MESNGARMEVVMRKLANTLWGIVLVVIGVILTLNALEITNINIFFDGWWTLFIIIPSAIELIARENKFWSAVWLIIGILLLLACRDILDIDLIWRLTIPVLLILIGINLIFKDKIDRKMEKKNKELKEKGQNLEEYGATFGEIKADFNNQEFNGANINAIFGSVDLDLRKAIISEDKLIKTCAVFGGIEILAPENVNIKVKSIPIFGATSNKKGRKYDEKLPTIYVDSFCMFGGVDIK